MISSEELISYWYFVIINEDGECYIFKRVERKIVIE